MNIQPLNYNLTRKYRHRYDYKITNPQNKQKSGDLCEQGINNGYNIAFSGGLNTSGTVANTFMEKILKNRVFKWLTEFSGEHNIASSALISLFLAGLLRPAATVALPGKKDKDDKIYAAGHSMSSGIIGFIFSTILTSPLDSGSKFMLKDGKKMSKTDFQKMNVDEIRKYMSTELNMDKDDIEKCIKEGNAEKKITRKFEKGITHITEKTDKINELKRKLNSDLPDIQVAEIKKQIRNLEQYLSAYEITMKNIVEWGIAIPRATLTIALIPPILKYVFHLEKKKPAEIQEAVPQQKALSAVSLATFFNAVSNKDAEGGQK